MRHRNVAGVKNAATERARQLRQRATPAEATLWQYLRVRQVDGIKFRWQEPIGPYITDFACLPARLIVELDGLSHENRAPTDARRDQWLQEQGFKVLRIANDEIRHNIRGVLETILDECHTRLKAHQLNEDDS